MSQFSLLSMAAHLTMITTHIASAEHCALDRASSLVLEEIRHEIGTYQGAAGPFPGWAPLRPETIAKKRNGDTPLLETGEMRDSYERTIDGNNAYVGSNNMKALYHELGTSTIPPRSVIGMAAVHREPQIVQETGRLFFGVLNAQSAPAVAQILHSNGRGGPARLYR
jgi:phage gpG-like protein